MDFSLSGFDIFDMDSDFMKGFETGFFLLFTNGDVEDYGCSNPKDANTEVQAAYDKIKMGITAAKSKLEVDPIIDQGLSLVMYFLDGLLFFIPILKPEPG